MSGGGTVMQTIARTDVEDFLFAEAELLDEWRLPEWLELFTDMEYSHTGVAVFP